MNWVLSQIQEKSFISHSQQPYSPPPSDNFILNSNLSPSILIIIVLLAIIFFISGLFHLFIRCLLKPSNTQPEDFESVTVLQGQLQQLFHLHDAGVDQSFIDTLPIFNYKSIIGSKNPFDCAVCLCEFQPEDELRLLPQCSHAFHIECIDTWLLSHSSCPLCRACLLPEFPPNNTLFPIVCVLESGSESSREIGSDRVVRTNSHLGFRGGTELGSTRMDFSNKDEKFVHVKLGKFRNVDSGEGSSSSTSNSNKELDARRCFSMGSYAYIMDENSSLQVPIAMSECNIESKREFNGFEVETNEQGNAIGRGKTESFSVSKIWLRGKKEKENFEGGSTRRAFSLRYPAVGRNVVVTDDGDEMKEGTNLDSQANLPSFGRTLLRLVGRQNKVVHSSFAPSV